jgi:glycosyltransferase involved in cell wall biosynthesis
LAWLEAFLMLLLNYTPVLRQPTGIGVYANAVLPALQGFPHALLPGGQEGTARQRLQRLAWSQVRLPRLASRQGASLIFTPAPEGYLGPQHIPQVVMVHDLRPISHPERSLQSLYFRAWVPPLLRGCRHILTNSEFTARELQRCVGISDERITVIPLGYDSEVFRPAVQGPLRKSGQPYLLHVGQAYPHKNLRRLIQAFAELALRDSDIRLVVAGKPHPKESPMLKRLVSELALEKRIEFLSYVSYGALPALYQGAMGFVYPSLWEGFGLPILEAMACGTPVITSLGSGTQEVGDDAALLVDPMDVRSMAQAMEDLIKNHSLRSQLRERGLRRAEMFSWETTGAMTARVLQGLV